MQLFITDYTREENIITLHEERVVHQLSHVLRGKPGMKIMVQKPLVGMSSTSDETNNGDINNTGNIDHSQIAQQRYTCEIISLDKKNIIASIVSQEQLFTKDNEIYLSVGLPNKFEKLELIVQKCTEIGIQHFYFFPSQYSQLRELSKNKMERLSKIALEAVEQSYGTVVPTISYCPSIEDILLKRENIVCHQNGDSIKNMRSEEKIFQEKNNNSIKNISLRQKNGKNIFVGPEGGRGTDDEKIFDKYECKKISLGKNILRTETASIIASWEAVFEG